MVVEEKDEKNVQITFYEIKFDGRHAFHQDFQKIRHREKLFRKLVAIRGYGRR